MTILPTIEDMQKQSDEIRQAMYPVMSCCICGKKLPIGLMHNFNPVIQIGSPGYPTVQTLQCVSVNATETEHWTCSVDCFTKAAHACIDEHIVPQLKIIEAMVHPS